MRLNRNAVKNSQSHSRVSIYKNAQYENILNVNATERRYITFSHFSYIAAYTSKSNFIVDAFTLYILCTPQANLSYIFLRTISIRCFSPSPFFFFLDHVPLYILFFPPTFSREFDFANQPIFTFHQIPNLLLNRTNFPPSPSRFPALYYQFCSAVFSDTLIKVLLSFSILTNRHVFFLSSIF